MGPTENMAFEFGRRDGEADRPTNNYRCYTRCEARGFQAVVADYRAGYMDGWDNGR